MLVSVLSQFLSSFVPSQDSSTKIIFVKEGQTPKNIKKKPKTGLLHSAPKWKLLYDCDGSPTIPSFLAVTTLRPDIVLYACCIKTVIMLELTCPCEENMPYWHDTKNLKRVIVTPTVYTLLVEFLHFDIQSTRQKSHCFKTVSGHCNALFCDAKTRYLYGLSEKLNDPQIGCKVY